MVGGSGKSALYAGLPESAPSKVSPSQAPPVPPSQAPPVPPSQGPPQTEARAAAGGGVVLKSAAREKASPDPGPPSKAPSKTPLKGILKKKVAWAPEVLGPGCVIAFVVEGGGRSEKEARKAVEKYLRPIAAGLKARVCPEYGRKYEISVRCESTAIGDDVTAALRRHNPLGDSALQPRVIEVITREPVPEVVHGIPDPALPDPPQETDQPDPEPQPSAPVPDPPAEAPEMTLPALSQETGPVEEAPEVQPEVPEEEEDVEFVEPMEIVPSKHPSSLTLAQVLGIDTNSPPSSPPEPITPREPMKEPEKTEPKVVEAAPKVMEVKTDPKAISVEVVEEVKEESEEDEEEEDPPSLEPMTLRQQYQSPMAVLAQFPTTVPSPTKESRAPVLAAAVAELLGSPTGSQTAAVPKSRESPPQLSPAQEAVVQLFVGQTAYTLTRPEASTFHRRVHGAGLPEAVFRARSSAALPTEMQEVLSVDGDVLSLCGPGRRAVLWSELVYLWLRYPEAGLRGDHLYAAFTAAHRHRPGPLDFLDSKLTLDDLPDWVAKRFPDTLAVEAAASGPALRLTGPWRTALLARKLLVATVPHPDMAGEEEPAGEPSDAAQMRVGELVSLWEEEGRASGRGSLVWGPEMEAVLSLTPQPDSEEQMVRSNPAFLRILRHIKRDMDVYEEKEPLTAGPGVYPRYRPSPTPPQVLSPAKVPASPSPQPLITGRKSPPKASHKPPAVASPVVNGRRAPPRGQTAEPRPAHLPRPPLKPEIKSEPPVVVEESVVEMEPVVETASVVKTESVVKEEPVSPKVSPVAECGKPLAFTPLRPMDILGSRDGSLSDGEETDPVPVYVSHKDWLSAISRPALRLDGPLPTSLHQPLPPAPKRRSRLAANFTAR